MQPTEYLTFSSDNPFTLSVATPNWDGTMYYSLNTTEWIEWDGSEISSTTIYLRGKGNTRITGDSGIYKWTLTGTNISCNGNIETLLDYTIVEVGEHPSMANYCYSFMFSGCTSLTTAPTLPATTLTTYCYCYIFHNCTSLTTAPELPATTLASYCYQGMFYGCTSLTTAPALPATTLTTYCYYYMFYGCTSLTTAPELPATTLASSCYRNMFYNCTSLTTAPELPATTLADHCYYYMFRDCTKIKLSTTKTGKYTTAYRIPKSGTGTTATNALGNMFTGTGGTFTGTPSINTTYYLHSSNSVV